jgi:small GTP-binding protein
MRPKKTSPTPTEQLPPGFRLRHILGGEGGTIHRIAWSPDGELVAAACMDERVRIWNATTGTPLHELKGHNGAVFAVAFSPDGSLVASAGSDKRVWLWHTSNWNCIDRLKGHRSDIWDVAFSPDGTLLASASDDRTIGLWGVTQFSCCGRLEGHKSEVWGVAFSRDGALLASGSADRSVGVWQVSDQSLLDRLPGHAAPVFTLAFSPDDLLLATASVDGTIRLWQRRTLRPLVILEGHQDSVEALSFSADGKLLASKSLDGTIRLWNCSSWEPIGALDERMQDRWHPGLAFHPTEPVLATLGESDAVVRIWDLRSHVLRAASSVDVTTHYANARVVFLGNASTGKTCLTRALLGLPFAPQEATHGMKVTQLAVETPEPSKPSQIPHADAYTAKREADAPGDMVREIFLWDLAGQVDYQLVHQLFLDQAALAIVVFDSTHPEDPFGGVVHWANALRRAAGEGCPRLLVAGRVDRGHPSVTPEDIEAFRRQHGFDRFLATSAKTGVGVEELREAIKQAIRWERLPVTSTPGLWKAIRAYLLQRRTGKVVLTRHVDLREAFRERYADPPFTDAEFCQVLDHAQAQGLVWRLSFGDFVLLKTELLNDYAAAIVRAARHHAAGLGCVAESEVLQARIDFEDLDRLDDTETERSLLHAVVQLLLDRELAIRESDQLVFPSKFNRQRPGLAQPEPREVIYHFSGPIEEIYATLVVRLFYCGAFSLKALWKNAAEFYDELDNLCDVLLSRSSEAEGAISVVFAGRTPVGTKVLFLRFIYEHLHQRAHPGSVHRERVYRCPACGEEVTNRRAVELRLSKGSKTIACQFCDKHIELVDILETEFANTQLLQQIREMERQASAGRTRAVGLTIVGAKESVREYDVFLAHNSADKPQVEAIGEALKRRGLNPWLDEEQIPPGRWFQDVIQQAIRTVKSAAVFVGPQGLGRWQALELRSFIAECVERHVPVIPVLLPGVDDVPSELVFLKGCNLVKFGQDVEDLEALDRLQWGITGVRSQQGEG